MSSVVDVADVHAGKRSRRPERVYEELKHLGSGAFGSAVLVRRRRDGCRFVAKKCCIEDLDEKQRKLCLEEIGLLRKVQHPCVAEVADFRWASRSHLKYWIVLKYYPGGDVQQQIDHCRETNMEIPVGKAGNWITQLCMALDHVHSRKIVHRDVKGSNIFITGADNVVLGDFGASKQLTASAAKAMTSVGSPVFMAPEWWDGRGGTSLSDMWSVGVVLYELATLSRPFEAGNVLSLVYKVTNEDPSPLPEDVDAATKDLVGQLLLKDPEQRPSAREALESPCLRRCFEILQIYRGPLEHISDKRQLEEARAEDMANGVLNASLEGSQADESASFDAAVEALFAAPVGMVNLVPHSAQVLAASQTSLEAESASHFSLDDADEDVEVEEDDFSESEDEDESESDEDEADGDRETALPSDDADSESEDTEAGEEDEAAAAPSAEKEDAMEATLTLATAVAMTTEGGDAENNRASADAEGEHPAEVTCLLPTITTMEPAPNGVPERTGTPSLWQQESTPAVTSSRPNSGTSRHGTALLPPLPANHLPVQQQSRPSTGRTTSRLRCSSSPPEATLTDLATLDDFARATRRTHTTGESDAEAIRACLQSVAGSPPRHERTVLAPISRPKSPLLDTVCIRARSPSASRSMARLPPLEATRLSLLEAPATPSRRDPAGPADKADLGSTAGSDTWGGGMVLNTMNVSTAVKSAAAAADVESTRVTGSAETEAATDVEALEKTIVQHEGMDAQEAAQESVRTPDTDAAADTSKVDDEDDEDSDDDDGELDASSDFSTSSLSEACDEASAEGEDNEDGNSDGECEADKHDVDEELEDSVKDEAVAAAAGDQEEVEEADEEEEEEDASDKATRIAKKALEVHKMTTDDWRRTATEVTEKFTRLATELQSPEITMRKKKSVSKPWEGRNTAAIVSDTLAGWAGVSQRGWVYRSPASTVAALARATQGGFRSGGASSSTSRSTLTRFPRDSTPTPEVAADVEGEVTRRGGLNGGKGSFAVTFADVEGRETFYVPPRHIASSTNSASRTRPWVGAMHQDFGGADGKRRPLTPGLTCGPGFTSRSGQSPTRIGAAPAKATSLRHGLPPQRAPRAARVL
mmetsp:Transcript_59838/g.142541  ORF Transcript_59838/g.142541 Transcript_59838/m.142541 type:complete len:1102 (+) Transcript_59838:94-3399(+)